MNGDEYARQAAEAKPRRAYDRALRAARKAIAPARFGDEQAEQAYRAVAARALAQYQKALRQADYLS